MKPDDRIQKALEAVNNPENNHAFCCGKKSENFKTIQTALAYMEAAINEGRFGWQPMETAPKDGTDILIANQHVQFIALADEHDDDGWWIIDWIEERKAYGWQKSSFLPTHWQPLPQKDSEADKILADWME